MMGGRYDGKKVRWHDGKKVRGEEGMMVRRQEGSVNQNFNTTTLYSVILLIILIIRSEFFLIFDKYLLNENLIHYAGKQKNDNSCRREFPCT